ncbi:MAG TPA: Hsp20/alpha crystallin family protein [Bacteroidales bacterium]|nr:Hsp20/alpha crystallin family protein [Bacteroidales bacterium]
MAYIRFYSPVRAAYGKENSDESYEQLMKTINSDDYCGCRQGIIPASNITETEKEYRIEMVLPGVDKKSIRIIQEKGNLTVRLEESEEKESNDNYTRHEFDYSGASRTFSTGDKVDQENVSAKYENGILTLHLPKKEAFVSKPAQSITVE